MGATPTTVFQINMKGDMGMSEYSELQCICEVCEQCEHFKNDECDGNLVENEDASVEEE